MARDNWAGVRVAPAMEFIACQEIRRFCLTCFLPQRRVRVWPKGVTEPFLYATPLIRGRLLMPLAQARDRALHYARGCRGPKFLVDDAEGRPWTVADDAVRELSCFEREGAFDAPLSGNMARLEGGELLAAVAGEALAHLFAPLFPAPASKPPVLPTKAELEQELLEAGRPASGPPVPPWVDMGAIRASISPEVLARAENYTLDDRTSEQRSADASRARACALAAQGPGRPRFTYGASAKRVDLSQAS
jgi:hypothetical protein